MNNNRLLQLETLLEILHAQQATLEQEALLTTGLPKTQAEQRLLLEIKPKIEEYKKEYWQILASQAGSLAIPEQEAEAAIIEIVEFVGQVEVNQSATYPDEVLQILQEIRDKLNQPGASAAAKLKGIISSIPPFVGVSYEAEIDMENFFRTYFPTFTHLIKGAATKK
ncbi:hypothetical protein [Microcoleus sp. FACHB-672]|uniref:hypothetical protein n=1 Tax=Microcoleus sp. FACHB-672 TaxID=2692825 RepID=UPI0016854301|nr:hypothetical protein [Microcoleus sp. FACHB-672]MBD2043768.1 hypothetical protein [Microcoleus sp. FACHB-672]